MSTTFVFLQSTSMPDDDFDFSFEDTTTPLPERFQSEENTAAEIFPLTIVWHEMGHIFGRVIVQALGNEYGSIIKISLLRYTPFVQFDEEKNQFILKAYFEKDDDYYGYENVLLDTRSDNFKKLERNEFDHRRLLCYVIYLLSGGLFNIYIYNDSPEEYDFETCFNNVEEGTLLEEIRGCGGDDWNKSRILLGFAKFDLVEFKNFRQELFTLMKNTGFFTYCKDFITQIYIDNQNKTLGTQESAKLYFEAEQLFENFRNKNNLLDSINVRLQSFLKQNT